MEIPEFLDETDIYPDDPRWEEQHMRLDSEVGLLSKFFNIPLSLRSANGKFFVKVVTNDVFSWTTEFSSPRLTPLRLLHWLQGFKTGLEMKGRKIKDLPLDECPKCGAFYYDVAIYNQKFSPNIDLKVESIKCKNCNHIKNF
jgi:hypothetical protein